MSFVLPTLFTKKCTCNLYPVIFMIPFHAERGKSLQDIAKGLPGSLISVKVMNLITEIYLSLIC